MKDWEVNRSIEATYLDRALLIIGGGCEIAGAISIILGQSSLAIDLAVAGAVLLIGRQTMRNIDSRNSDGK